MTTAIPPHAGQPVLTRGLPLGEGHAVVIMVHGRGAGPENIIDLARAFDRPDVTYLAPGASGGTWYPSGFMSPIAQNEPGISSGISVIHSLIDDVVARGIPTERIVLLGFSQGACLASTSAQRRPAKYGGVIAYSGGLIGPPGTAWNEDGAFLDTPAFFGCSRIEIKAWVHSDTVCVKVLAADTERKRHPAEPSLAICVARALLELQGTSLTATDCARRGLWKATTVLDLAVQPDFFSAIDRGIRTAQTA